MKPEKGLISKFKKTFQWLDENVLFALAVFLMVFIPLFPKIPLADLIQGYIVRLRIEDLLIAVAAGIWFIQVIRRKVSLRTPLTWIISAYLVVGLLSSLSAMFYVKSLPLTAVHVTKLFLHYFRRIEYFSVFFIFYSAVKNKKRAIILFAVFLISTLLVSLYGFGQKYFYWPVYSTMNREFSKGLRLYLTEHARVQSTFGGHYDFAAFLVIGLPILVALAGYVKNKWLKVFMWFIYLWGLWGLMMTSSRSSFLAYIAAVTVVLIYLMRKNLLLGIARLFIVYFISFSFMFMFGDLSERFSQIFQGNESYQSFLNTVNDMKDKSTQPLVAPPSNAISIDDVVKAAEEAQKREEAKTSVVGKSDTQPVIVKPGEEAPTQSLPPDVFENIPNQVIATKSAEGKDIVVVIPRIFSENAHRFGLSAAIRMDTLWPFAIKGFLRNPLLGSGYSTLTKYSWAEFTEAESTDNDFLRTLGETGLLGFITFYGVMVVALIYLHSRAAKTKSEEFYAIYWVALAVTVGLAMNAMYIDVFISSKVIETYWALLGTAIAYVSLPLQGVKSSTKQKQKAEI